MFVYLGIERLKNKVMLEFRKVSLEDYMGFSWYAAYRDGLKVLVEGVHLQYHAKSKAHALRMYNQLPR